MPEFGQRSSFLPLLLNACRLHFSELLRAISCSVVLLAIFDSLPENGKSTIKVMVQRKFSTAFHLIYLCGFKIFMLRSKFIKITQ